MRNEEGRCSGWYEVAQGFRQGCVFSPLLFNVFFAATLPVELDIFSNDADILADPPTRTAVESWPYNGTGMYAACYLGDDVC